MNSITGNLRTVLDNLYDGVYLVDKNRKILYWNKAAEEITGYLSSEVVGTSCQDNKLNHVDSKGKNYCKDECPLLAIFNDGEMKELEIFLHHKEGYRIPIYAKVIPYKNEEGDLVGALCKRQVLFHKKRQLIFHTCPLEFPTDLSVGYFFEAFGT